MKEKLKLLEGMDSYLPHVDGVINCMHNYCINSYKRVDLTAAAPFYKGYKEVVPYKIVRCKSIHLPFLNIQYGRATKDRKFKKQIMAQKYDIVHVHSPFNMAKFALKVAKKQKIPAVITFHTNAKPIAKQALKFDWLAERFVKKLGRLYNKFDEVFVCSPPVAEQCRSFGYTGKISYLPYGTELPKCNDVAKLREVANKQLGLSEDELVFIHVGRTEKLKRIDFILDSLKILKDKGYKFKFYVIGKGGAYDSLVAYSKKLGLEDCVVFTGFVENELLPLYNARADLLLFPSLYDNFGLVKVEAAAYDTAGVFIEGSCAGYGVTDGENGFLADDNVKAFAQKIIDAISDKAKLATIGKNAGRDLYINWKECTDQLLTKLEQIVNESKKV